MLFFIKMTQKYRIAIGLVLFFLCCPSFAQKNTSYLKSYVTDAYDIYFSPLTWDRTDILKSIGVISLTAGLYFQDQKIFNFVKKTQSPWRTKLSNFSENFGDAIWVVPSVASLYVFGSLFDDSKLKTLSLNTLKSLFFSGITTHMVRYSVHRKRPKPNVSYADWEGPDFTYHSHLSFPSGHSTVAWTLATNVAQVYRQSPWVPYATYTLASLTSFSRIDHGHHWPSDVLAGAWVGHFISKKIHGFSIRPSASAQFRGMTISMKF